MFIAYASGSAGNFYEADDGTTRLGLECGLTIKKMQSACGNTLAGIQDILITHEHGDHAKGAKELLKRGVNIHASLGTLKALGLDTEPMARVVEPFKQITIGTFAIKAFPVVHDAAEPLGYLIQSLTTGEKLLFATDTAAINHRFRGCTEIAIECNYCETELTHDTALPMRVIHRIRHSHMAVEDLERYLTMWDLTGTKQIYLIHLSTRHAYAEEFVRRIGTATGVPTKAIGTHGGTKHDL